MSFSSLTYQQKTIALIIGTLILSVLVYKMALGKTLTAYQQISTNEQKLTEALKAPDDITFYKSKLMSINASLNAYEASTRNDHEHVLAYISKFCSKNKITLRNYPPLQEITEEDITILTHKIEVQGHYTKLVKLLYQLELQEKMGRIASVKFENKRDRQSRKKYLSVLIFLQNINFNKLKS